MTILYAIVAGLAAICLALSVLLAWACRSPWAPVRWRWHFVLAFAVGLGGFAFLLLRVVTHG